VTKKLTEDQEAILAVLEGKGAVLAKARELQEVCMHAVHEEIRKGFRAGISGYKLSKASGMSLPRIYQLNPRRGGKGARAAVQTPTSD
jgi:hypothetical protein